MPSLRTSLMLSFAERYSSLLIGIVSTVILARLLTPAETGLYSVVAGIISIAQELRDFGIGNYVVQEDDLTRSRQATALGIAVGLGCLMVVLFVGASGLIADFFHEPRLKTIVLVMCPSFVLVAFASVGQAKLRRNMNFNAMLRLGIAASLVHSTTSIILAALGFGAVGMAWASVLGIAAGMIGNYIYLPQDILLLPSLREWRRVFDFGVFASCGYLLQEVGQRAPDIIVGRLLGFGSAGLYSRGNGLISLFQQAFLNAILPVTASALAQLNREDEDLGTPFLTYLNYTTAVAWPFLGMMAILSWPLIHIAFGDQWLSAVPVAQVLCFGAALWVPGRLSMTLFSAIGRVRRLLVVQGIAVPVQVAALVVGSCFSIEWAAVGTVVGNVVLSAFSLHHVNRALGTTWLRIASALSKSMAITAGSLAIPLAAMLWHGIGPNDFWGASLTAAFGGAASWLLCLFAIDHPLRQELMLALAKLRPARAAATKQES